MKYQFKAKLLKDGDIITRLINTVNLQSAILIAEYLYGKYCRILSVEEA